MSFWIDTHAHIYSDEFKPDRQDMLSRAVEADVQRIYMPNIDHTSIDNMLELETKSAGVCVSMMGLHPCYVNKEFEKELYLVEEWLGKRKFAAVGEIGTDLYWDKTFWGQQQEAFKVQVGWAKKYRLPIVIHCRESIDETIQLLEPMLDGQLTGVFHCFSGSVEQAKKIMAMGFYLGIGGVATFKNGGLEKVLPEIGLEKLILETDSPYLAPVPHRGKRNEPAYLPLVAQKICDYKKISEQELKDVTFANANRLFS
ncbi:MAG: TatD family hydrolase [Bacteroidota bacterium]|jgi:TatD DNase family protein|nr:TatD family hydrolase [Cytophagales bacterium]MCE2958945.1 TatD family hydrolase [Flammeovirgaceae bacterium]MCZ8070200.1 TatD family hydrolase [Cytophagales bacterium]